ncbi:SIMPL domain-containing protein [Candidatus Uhrbacteria bacterium]|nr:SIMPL domain-containing protein [Candidatus Uhrbacteria bacterium]
MPTIKESPGLQAIATALGILLVVFVAVRTVQSALQIGQIGKPMPTQNEISVDGEAKLRITPDLATISLGIETKAPTVAEAQEKNSKQSNALIDKLVAAGLDKKDAQQESYNVYEAWEWDQATQTNKKIGWSVNQSLRVDVRDLLKVPAVLQLAGQANVTSISGPNFQVENPNKYREEARRLALENARKNANELSKNLQVKLGDVLGYAEYISTGGGGPYPTMERAVDGMGGGAPAPTILPGTEEITFTVQVRYEIIR